MDRHDHSEGEIPEGAEPALAPFRPGLSKPPARLKERGSGTGGLPNGLRLAPLVVENMKFADPVSSMLSARRRKEEKERKAEERFEMALSKMKEIESHVPDTVTVPSYLVTPAEERPAPASVHERIAAINGYFATCAEQGRNPLLTELALASGYSGVMSMRRAALREPALRHAIGRAFTAIAVGYEARLDSPGAGGALFMLKNIPDFDSLDKPTALPEYSFKDRAEMEVKVPGVKTEDEEGAELSPREAYLRLVKNRIIETEEVIETVADESGTFISVEINVD